MPRSRRCRYRASHNMVTGPAITVAHALACRGELQFAVRPWAEARGGTLKRAQRPWSACLPMGLLAALRAKRYRKAATNGYNESRKFRPNSPLKDDCVPELGAVRRQRDQDAAGGDPAGAAYIRDCRAAERGGGRTAGGRLRQRARGLRTAAP